MKRKVEEEAKGARRHSSIWHNPKPIVSASTFPRRRHSIGSQDELKSRRNSFSEKFIESQIGQALSEAVARRVVASVTERPNDGEQDYRIRLNENMPLLIQGPPCEPILEGDDFSDSTATDNEIDPRLRKSFAEKSCVSSDKSMRPGYRIPSWRTNSVSYNKFEPLYPQLHDEIEEYALYTKSIVKRMAVQIEQTIDSVRECVRTLWPDASVETFGSYSTGIWLPDSDVDLVVLGVEQEESVQCLHKVAAMLEKQEWVHTILVVETAKVPVIKVVSSGTAVPIDITFESSSTHSGLLARDLVLGFCKTIPQLYPLAIILKQLLKERKLNEAYTGGLSSYSAVLMTVHFLQLWSAGPAAFENAALYASGSDPSHTNSSRAEEESHGRVYSSKTAKSDANVAEIVTSFDAIVVQDPKGNPETISEASTDSEMGDEATPNDETNLGLLLVSLLEFFSVVFNYKTSGISVREGGFIYRVRNEVNGTPPVIEDPIYPSNNVGSSSFAMKKVIACFEDAYYSLKYFRRTRFSPTALSCFLSHTGHTLRGKRETQIVKLKT